MRRRRLHPTSAPSSRRRFGQRTVDETPSPESTIEARMVAAEETLRAIGAGEVDAFVVSDGSEGQRVFTLSTADRPYRIFVENMRDGAATVSAGGLVLYANRCLAELLSCPRETIVGSPLASFMSDGAALETLLHGDHATLGGTLELELVSAEGRAVPVLVGVSPLEIEGHRLTCLTFTDLSGPKAQEREILRLSQAQAQQMADLREEFVLNLAETQKLEALGVVAGGIAHDFNNLLTVILGNTSIALDTLKAGSPERRPMEQVRLAAIRSAALAQQMLAYSGKGKFVVEVVGLAETVDELSELIGAAISKQAHVTLELTPGTPAIEADVTQLRQIILNLITNASEAIGDAGGDIRVRTGSVDLDRVSLSRYAFAENLPSGRYACFEVTDTGPGMDVQTKARIFDPFFTTKLTGRGLGLAAVQGIVRGHHGAIAVETEPGRGTTFTLIFPISAVPAPAARAAPTHATGLSDALHGEVLLVDDDDAVRGQTVRMLEQIGFTVAPFADGTQALTAFEERAGTFAFVLLDLMMPGISGDEMIAELQRIDASTPIVLSSGYNSVELSQRFADRNVTVFLQKPYELDQLRATAHEVTRAPVP
jgi:signal transduction histidine kinase